MPAKKFVPAGAGMTKAQIIEWMNDLADAQEVDEYVPRLTTRDLTNNNAQYFVNELEMFMDDHVDCREDAMVDDRDDLILDCMEILGAKLRGERKGFTLAAAIREARGW